jgi:glycine cleavage system transcriptional repressor
VNELAVTVLGHDRPGIIADVAEILAGLGMNLTDSSMTRLRGHFAMTLVCVGELPSHEVTAALAPLTEDGDLTCAVRRVAPEREGGPAGGHFILTVHGADQLGIVAAMTRAVAEFGGNVTDLSTRLAGELYVLIAEVDLPATADGERLLRRLAAAAAALGVEVGLRPADADVL